MAQLFWGKRFPRSDEDARCHHLAHHSADVAACLEAFIDCPGIVRGLAGTAGLDRLDAVRKARLCCLAFLHDIGKANVGFQLQERWPDGRAGHVAPLRLVFDNDNRLAWFWNELGFEDFLAWDREGGQVVSSLFAAAVSHHGTPIDLFDDRPPPPISLWQPAAGLDPRAMVALMGRLCREWFAAAFAGTDADGLPAVAAFQHQFAGLCMLADWLGSDERFFPFVADFDPDYMATARRQARSAIAEVGLDVAAQRQSFVPPEEWRTLFDFNSPNVIQKAAAELPLDAPLVVLESETGSGKTEAAFWHFARLYGADLVDGLYFALPTRAAASQLHRRVSAMVAHLFRGPHRPETVLAVPGYLRAADATGTSLPDFQVLWDDAPDSATRDRRWAAENSKRYLAAQIAVGTVDQAMLAALAVKHAHLRAACLARSLLVIDEVHASDPYMRIVLRHLLNCHLESGGRAMLLSATLGSALLAGLAGGPRQPPPVELAAAVPYPTLTCPAVDGNRLISCSGNGRDKAVNLDLLPALDRPREVAMTAVAAARQGARVLVVCNTVGTAVAVQAAVEETAEEGFLFRLDDVVTLHHGRFAPDDRKALDDAVERVLGKDAERAGGLVLVGTQTLEQSLDIDADLLITALCPVDVLLQRIGRLHRHAGRRRPEGFDRPRCVVLAPAERSLERWLVPRRDSQGLGTIYPDVAMLEAVLRLIEAGPVWSVPADNRRLVEKGTHPEALGAIVQEKGKAWKNHARTMEGRQLAERMVGRNSLLPRGKDFLDRDVRFPDREEEIRTRLGAEGPDAAFDPPVPGPFGRAVHHLPIPAILAKGAGEALAPGEVTPLNGGGFAFAWGNRRFTYDRLGLRPKEADSYA